MIEVPLNNSPEQIFSIVLGDTSYDTKVALNSRVGIWSISFSQNGVDIINGVALLGGVDIFAHHSIPISNAYVVNLNDTSLDPDKDNLGVVAKLFILTDEEVGNE